MSMHPPRIEEGTISKSDRNMSGSLNYGALPYKQKELDNFRHLANTLKEEGCDIIVTEMMMDNKHSPLVLQAASETGLPILVGFTCRVQGDNIMLRDSDVNVKDVIEDWMNLPGVIGATVMHQPFETTIPTLNVIKP